MSNLFNKLKEETTSGDIAFEPGGGMRPLKKKEKNKLKDLSKEEHENLGGTMETIQQITEVVEHRLNEVMHARLKLTENNRQRVMAFLRAFPKSVDRTPKNNKIAFEHNLPLDLGQIEMVLSALEEKRDFRKYGSMNLVNYLFAKRLLERDCQIVYESLYTSHYAPLECIYFLDPVMKDHIIESLPSIGKGLTLRHEYIYPVTGAFDPNFFIGLREVIDEYQDEEVE